MNYGEREIENSTRTKNNNNKKLCARFWHWLVSRFLDGIYTYRNVEYVNLCTMEKSEVNKREKIAKSKCSQCKVYTIEDWKKEQAHSCCFLLCIRKKEIHGNLSSSLSVHNSKQEKNTYILMVEQKKRKTRLLDSTFTMLCKIQRYVLCCLEGNLYVNGFFSIFSNSSNINSVEPFSCAILLIAFLTTNYFKFKFFH